MTFQNTVSARYAYNQTNKQIIYIDKEMENKERNPVCGLGNSGFMYVSVLLNLGRPQ